MKYCHKWKAMKLLALANEYEKATKELDSEEKERLDYYRERKGKGTDSKGLYIHKQELGKIENFVVYLVDGEQVRNKIDQDFTTGGNAGRYTYIPEGEVWIEGGMTPDDVLCTIIHEFLECYYMENKGYEYDHAHDMANAFERQVRVAIQKGRLHIGNDAQALAHARALVEKIISRLAEKKKE